MESMDMRFNEKKLKDLIGKTFNKYIADPFMFANTATGVVGLSIGDKLFALNNIQENVDYFGNNEKCGVFKFDEIQSVSSLFEDIKQVDTLINNRIIKITLINENQRIIQDNVCLYDVWLTRGIIFHFNEYEISFQKDVVPFSEEIIVRKGCSLIENFDGMDEFMEGWNESIKPIISRENIVLQ